MKNILIKILKHSLLCVGIFIFCILLLIFTAPNLIEGSSKYTLTWTENINKDDEIKEFLINSVDKDALTGGFIKNADNTGRIRCLSIYKNKINYKDYTKLVADLITSPIMDESVIIDTNAKYTRNPEKMLKRHEKKYEDIIREIDGVKSAHVSIDTDKISDKADFYDIYGLYSKNNIKIERVSVDCETAENADCEKIKKALYYLLSGIMKEENYKEKININFNES